MAESVRSIVEKINSKPLAAYYLECLVEDVFGRQAREVNAGGPEKQIEFLLGTLGEEHLLEEIDLGQKSRAPRGQESFGRLDDIDEDDSELNGEEKTVESIITDQELKGVI